MKNSKIHDFPYDAFQSQAIQVLDRKESLMVAAPTGAGKTVLAEYVTHQSLQEGKGVIYTAPIKALSNQKFRDFCERYGRDQVGILTGDVVLNPGAPVLIMTTEIFRNRLFEPEGLFEDRTWVIFDEIHYLDDFERGTVWEESLIFFPEHLRLLALSATIPNIQDLARWVASVHKRPVPVIVENKRPVPLTFEFMAGNRFYPDFNQLFRRAYRARPDMVIRQPRGKRHPNELETLVERLKERGDFPAIYFCFSRSRCEGLARKSREYDLMNPGERDATLAAYDALVETFQMGDDPHAAEMRPFIEHGIAYHHAGILPVMKEIIERLFTGKFLRLIFTTETFAIGINMPARMVVFDELRKYYGTGFDNLKTRDFYQMAGRAGRRGYDDHGIILVCLDPGLMTFKTLQGIIEGESEAVQSRFNSNYATLLQLYKLRGDAVVDIYPLSFHYFQSSRKQKHKRLEQLKNKLRLLRHLGYIDDRGLTARGVFASRIFGYELAATELFIMGFFEDSEPWEINCMITAMIFEPRRGQAPPRLTKPMRRLKKLADGLIYDLKTVENQFGMAVFSKPFFFHLSEAVLAWMDGATLDDLCRITEIDEGEIIRNFRMTIQILREFRHIPGLSDAYYEKMEHCSRVLKRDAMDAEAQLMMG